MARKIGAAPLGPTLRFGSVSKSREALKNKESKPIEETAQGPAELERLLTPKETADLLRVSESWLAKSRMRGDGPPFTKKGRSVGYLPSGVVCWLKSRQRSSTSE